jgi:hypothetical protein
LTRGAAVGRIVLTSLTFAIAAIEQLKAARGLGIPVGAAIASGPSPSKALLHVART